MALSASSMKTKIFLALDAAGITYDGTAIVGNNKTVDQVITAFCQGVVDEIKANALVTTTSGAPDSEHSGNVK